MSKADERTITINPGISYCYRDGKMTVQVTPPAESGLWPLDGTRVCDFDEIKHLLSDRPMHRPPKYRRPEK